MLFEPTIPNDADRMHHSFSLQGSTCTRAMRLRRAHSGSAAIEPGWVPSLMQQDGLVQTGTVATALDPFCRDAAFPLMAKDQAVLTTGFEINLLPPDRVALFRMQARVTPTRAHDDFCRRPCLRDRSSAGDAERT